MKKIRILILILIVSNYYKAQIAGNNDSTFNYNDIGNGYGEAANGAIKALAIQSDGKILIGGDFTLYNTSSINRIVRLKSNGDIDTTFKMGSGVNASVNSISVQSDGKIIIAGNFTSYNGTPINRIIRLNSNGTIDASFNIGSGANALINTTTIQPDGNIIIAGNFTTFNGVSKNYISRLTSNGAIDPTFVSGSGANGFIYASAIQPDGNILLAGVFTSYNSTTSNRIIRLTPTGSIDASFVIGTGPSSAVNAISLQTDGNIIIGGSFYNYNGTLINSIARLNTNGTLDPTFAGGTDLSASVRSTQIQSDGKIIIAGNFNFYNNVSRKCIARLNTDGTLDTTFKVGVGALPNIWKALVQPDGKVLIGGDFTSYNTTLRNYIARINSNGKIDNTFNGGTGANSSVTAIAIQPDNKILVGGNFQIINGLSQNRIARLNYNGTVDTTFIPGIGANGAVHAIVVQPDGKIIIGGSFLSYNGVSQYFVTRLNANGSIDTAFHIGTGFNQGVSSISLQSDGKIILGGQFTTYNGITVNNVVRLNTNGLHDPTFNVGPQSLVNVTKTSIQSDGKILIAGHFGYVNSFTRTYIARLNSDGTVDNTFTTPTGAGIDSYINTLVIQQDGKIVVGGSFNYYYNTSKKKIARINSDGTLDAGFNVGTGIAGVINAIDIQQDGKIIAAGTFTSYNGVTRNNIVRINTNGLIDLTFDPGSGSFGNSSSNIAKIALQQNEQIIIVGFFTSYNNVPRNRMARIENGGAITNVVSAINSDQIDYPFPNPTINNLTLNLKENSTIEITNILGEIVYIENLNEGTQTIIFNNNKNGIYFVKVTSENVNSLYKIIKQ